jgi:hypothetical protein
MRTTHFPARTLPCAALVAAALLAGCAARAAPGSAAVAARMPARPPPTVCLGCGTISAREPGELPRWKYHVQMDDGTESIVFQDRADWLVVGARVRLAGGTMQKP